MPDVISGDREARLSFTGALSGVRVTEEPVLVMDIGGGSTELIVGSAVGTMTSAISLDIGSVRMTERFLKAGPPTPEAVAAATGYVDDMLERSGVDFESVRTWIGVAGTATTLAGVHLGLPQYDRAQVHGLLLTSDQVAGWARRLQSMTVEQIRALPSMHPGRADVITGGTLIASRVGSRTSAPGMVVSETDILDGIALELLQTR